jgi:hypothetical protein
MGFQIDDGSGEGNSAKVDKNKRIHTASVVMRAEETEAANGEAFIFHGECHLAAASSGGLMVITNDSTTHDVVFTRIFIDPQTLVIPIILTQVKRPATVTGGTDISATGIINKLYDSGKTSSCTLKISDASSDITFTGGEQYHAPFIRSQISLERDVEGTNILTPGTTIVFGWKTESGNATDADIIGLSVNMYRRERDS